MGWEVERTLAWLSQLRRLRVQHDKRADIHETLLSFGWAAADLLAVAAKRRDEGAERVNAFCFAGLGRRR
jgi:hypothetical protein